MKGSIEMNVLEGKLVAEGMKIGIVCARFNEFITSKLLGGAMDALVRHGVADSDVDVALHVKVQAVDTVHGN